MKRATCYLIIEPTHNFAGVLTGIDVVRIVKTKPLKLSPRFVALQLNVDVDEALFQQFLPEATITVRDTRELMTPVVTVEPQPESDADDAAADEQITQAVERLSRRRR